MNKQEKLATKSNGPRCGRTGGPCYKICGHISDLGMAAFLLLASTEEAAPARRGKARPSKLHCVQTTPNLLASEHFLCLCSTYQIIFPFSIAQNFSDKVKVIKIS